MIFDIIFIALGIFIVLTGADWLTKGASSIARRFNVSEMVIGLTIVACGTSMPELFVSMMSAIQGTPDLAVGNVVGSNIMNALLIVGCAAIAAPMTISKSTVVKDIPFAVAASLLLLVLCMDSLATLTLSGNTIGRIDGAILAAGFAAFMAYTLWQARKGEIDMEEDVHEADVPAWKSVALIATGLAALIIGSNVFVAHASQLAAALGISDAIIGLTIVAGGTSLPELATSVVAARKGKAAMAIGNVIGSNVFNILLILGLTAIITPLQIQGITVIDLAMMLFGIAAVWMFSFTKYTIERWEGWVLTLTYLAYLVWLLYNV